RLREIRLTHKGKLQAPPAPWQLNRDTSCYQRPHSDRSACQLHPTLYQWSAGMTSAGSTSLPTAKLKHTTSSCRKRRGIFTPVFFNRREQTQRTAEHAERSRPCSYVDP